MVKGRGGFTLVELLVSVVLLGLTITLINQFILFIRQPVRLHRSEILIHAQQQFEALLNDEIAESEVVSQYGSIQYSTIIDSSESLAHYQLMVEDRRSEKMITKYETWRLIR